MAEGAGAGLLQQSGQDLASWKRLSHMCSARGGKSWLCHTYQAHRVEEDTLLEVKRFKPAKMAAKIDFCRGVRSAAMRECKPLTNWIRPAPTRMIR